MNINPVPSHRSFQSPPSESSNQSPLDGYNPSAGIHLSTCMVSLKIMLNYLYSGSMCAPVELTRELNNIQTLYENVKENTPPPPTQNQCDELIDAIKTFLSNVTSFSKENLSPTDQAQVAQQRSTAENLLNWFQGWVNEGRPR